MGMLKKAKLMEEAEKDAARSERESRRNQEPPATKQPTKKPLNDTESKVLELYNSGITVQRDIAVKMGVNPSTVNRALKRVQFDYPELLHQSEPESKTEQDAPISDTAGEVSAPEAPTQPEPEEAAPTENAAAENETGQQDTKEAQDAPQATQNAPESPVMVQTDKSAPAPEKAENEPQGKPSKPEKKEVFSFRAKVSDKARWNAYKIAAGETMETMGTAAMNEYMERHALTDGQKAIYDAMTANIDK